MRKFYKDQKSDRLYDINIIRNVPTFQLQGKHRLHAMALKVLSPVPISISLYSRFFYLNEKAKSNSINHKNRLQKFLIVL